MAAKKSTSKRTTKASAAKSSKSTKSSKPRARKEPEVVEETRDEARARIAYERRQALRERQGIA